MKFSYSLKWYLIFTLILIFNVVLFQTGIFAAIWAADLTKLSFVILGLFIASSLRCGYSIIKTERKRLRSKREESFGYFMSDLLLSIGMVGTVIGFIIIMQDFSILDFSDLSTIKDLIKNLGAGVATALYTTLSGLVANVFIRIQYFLLEGAGTECFPYED